MQRTRNGFTVIEILVVVAIMGLLASIAVAAFYNMGRAAAERIAAQEVYTAFIDARNRTLASEGDTVYGVYITETDVTRFTGPTYSAGDPENKVYTFDRGVAATSSLFASGSVAITFTRLTGEPSATGTVHVQGQGQTSTSTITIHASGLVEQ